MRYFYRMYFPGKSFSLLILFVCFSLLRLAAQITYLDSYFLQNKRFVHVQQPLDFGTYAYTSPLLNYTDFKAKNPAAAWLPDSVRVTPPRGIAVQGAAWALSVIQTADSNAHLPVLLFIADYDSLVSPVYADRNLNGDFNDDGPPIELVPGRIPEPIDLVSAKGVTFRIHLQAVAAVAPVPTDSSAAVTAEWSRSRLPRWRFGLTGHFGISSLKYQYRFMDGTREKTLSYDGPNNLKGLTLSGEYARGAWGIGLQVGFDHIFYWASTAKVTFRDYTCPTGEPCAWVDYEETQRGRDLLPSLRLYVGPRLSWLPRLGKDIRLGPVLSPGFLLYRNAFYVPDGAAEARFALGRMLSWEAGLQLQLDNPGGSALILRASAYQSDFDPVGYFESVGAQGLVLSHVGLRFSIGVGLWK